MSSRSMAASNCTATQGRRYLKRKCPCKATEKESQTLASSLKLCQIPLDLGHGKIIHAHIVQSGLHKDRFLGNMLVDMYGRCGAIQDALAAFSAIHTLNVFSWNIVMGACVLNGHAHEALSLFKKMQLDSIEPDRVTFLSTLSACADLKDLHEAKRVEACIANSELNVDVVISSALVNMYYKCGSLEDAQRIFDNTLERDVVCWNTMIAACSQHGQGKKALLLFRKMVQKGMTPSQATYSTLFSVCASEGSLDEGRLLHACLKSSSLVLDVVMGNALVSMYGKCNSMEEAQEVFDSMQVRNSVTWSAMIAACASQSQGNVAVRLFHQMQMENLIPDTITFTNILCACSCLSNLALGKQIHACISQADLTLDVVVGTSLVNMYGKCQCLDHAQSVFDRMSERDVVAHNAMITAYVQCGHKRKAVQCFQQMQLEGIEPGKVTFASVLDACSSEMTLTVGKFMHAHIVSSGFNLDVDMGTALIIMYGKHGKLKHVEVVFDGLPERDVVAWNAMIASCARQEQYDKVLQLFHQLQLESLAPNEATFASSLSACVTQGALADGKRMHTCIVGALFESDVVVGTALINMYAKCGSLEYAQMVFDVLPCQNGVTWNALIAAYAQHGYSKEALLLFHRMESNGVCADKATFSSVLSACSRAGYVDEGLRCFVSMLQVHGVMPTVQHFNCIIDLLGRAGRLEEGESLMSLMPSRPIGTSWTALLGACRMHLDLERGKRVADFMSKSDFESDSTSALLTNIFALAGKQEDSEKTRRQGIKNS